MKRFFLKYCPVVILSVYALLFIIIKHPAQDWDRVINSDGKAYYAYLTAIFIYNDLQYSFVEYYESTYYPDDRSSFKEFRVPVGDRVVNKAFPGQALLWLPFFLVAHILTIVLGLPADGYSIIYQYAIGISALFYLWLGCLVLKKLLSLLGASAGIACAIPAVIAFGTNLLYYTINEGSMTHTYSFAVITCTFYFLTLTIRYKQLNRLPMLAALLGLVAITRPVNGILFLTIPFWAGGRDNMKVFLRNIQGRVLLSSSSLVILLAVCIIPVVLWYLQAGKPLVYSYGDEYFNFTLPRIGKLLLSYEKGWFVYTPIAFLSFFGLIGIYRASRMGFFSLLVFWLIFIYISSCWWVWDYTSRFSQRIFIDFLGLTGVMLFYFLASIHKLKAMRAVGTAVLVLLILLNIFQYYQNWKWVYPKGPVTRETYWKYFFQVRPPATVNYPSNEDVGGRVSFCHDMESDNGWINPDGYVADQAHSGWYSSHTGGGDSVGTGIDKLIKPLISGPQAMVVISGWLYAASRKTDASIIVDLSTDGLTYFYRSFALRSHLVRNSWTFVQFATTLPRLQTNLDRIKIYTLHHTPEHFMYLDDLCIEFISLNFAKEPLPAVVDIPEKMIKSTHVVSNDMESDSLWPGTASLTETLALTGRRSSRIDSVHPYSVGYRTNLRMVVPEGVPGIKVSAYIRTTTDTSMALLIADFFSNGESFHYSSISLSPCLKKEAWMYAEFLVPMPDVIKDRDEVLIYFWNPSAKEIAYIDNLEVEFFSRSNEISGDRVWIDRREMKEKRTFTHDMEYSRGWKNESTLSDDQSLFGRQSCLIFREQPYSVSLQGALDTLFRGQGYIRISAFVLTDAKNSAVSLVTDFRRDGNSYQYEPCYMNGRTRFLEWERIEFTTRPPSDWLPGDMVSIYFWNASPEETFYIDNLSIEFIMTN